MQNHLALRLSNMISVILNVAMFVNKNQKFFHVGYKVSVRLLFSCTPKVSCARFQLFFNYNQSSENHRRVGFALSFFFHILKINLLKIFDTLYALLNHMLILGPRFNWRCANFRSRKLHFLLSVINTYRK